MTDTAGSIRKLSINGIPFDVMADANVTEVGSKYENSALPTSGRNMKKQVKRAQNREGIVIAANGAERDLLQQLAESQTDVPLSYETAGGDVYRTVGWIEFENRETEENRATVQMHPRDGNGWDSFLAT